MLPLLALYRLHIDDAHDLLFGLHAPFHSTLLFIIMAALRVRQPRVYRSQPKLGRMCRQFVSPYHLHTRLSARTPRSGSLCSADYANASLSLLLHRQFAAAAAGAIHKNSPATCFQTLWPHKTKWRHINLMFRCACHRAALRPGPRRPFASLCTRPPNDSGQQSHCLHCYVSYIRAASSFSTSKVRSSAAYRS